MNSCGVEYSFSATSTVAISVDDGVATAQEMRKQIFFAQPKVHQYKFAETYKMVLTDPLWLIAFFEQCQTTNKVAGILDKLKEKKQPKKRRWLIFLLLVAMI